MIDDTPTTRTYPRTLHGTCAAFRDATYASPITYAGPSLASRIINAAWWAVSVGLIGALVWVTIRLEGAL